jgi:hypothetical protein
VNYSSEILASFDIGVITWLGNKGSQYIEECLPYENEDIAGTSGSGHYTIMTAL